MAVLERNSWRPGSVVPVVRHFRIAM